MRNYEQELINRTEWIKELLEESHCKGIVYGNSGGKDSALVGILCKKACENTVGIIMPCASKRNYGEDTRDGLDVARQFNIETRTVDLTNVRKSLTDELSGQCSEKSATSFNSFAEKQENRPVTEISDDALKNIAPRLRMTTLYAIGASEGRLVAGTGNRDELYIGYYTKYGDGGVDFNPIADLTVGEVYEFLEYLNAPENIIKKAPSAGLFEGQTDEMEIGVSYADIDKYLLTGEATDEVKAVVDRMHSRCAHKRIGVRMYGTDTQ